MPGDKARAAFEPIVALLLLLSATTGLIDAVSVLGLGKVFTANMTGNIVFLGFALAGAPGFHWPVYVTALLAFAVGAFGAGRLGRRLSAGSRRLWLIVVAGLESGLLLLAAVIAARTSVAADQTVSPAAMAMIALTAAAMGVRNATVRTLKVSDLTTTVLTLTITGLAADGWGEGGLGRAHARRLLAVFAILVGAGIGAVLLLKFGLATPLVVAAVVVFLATLLLAQEEKASQTRM